jgi:hypothetical protein
MFWGKKKRRSQWQNKRAVTHYEVYERFGNEYLEVQTVKITYGFRATGHYPLNRNSFGHFDFDATIEDHNPLAGELLSRKNCATF